MTFYEEIVAEIYSAIRKSISSDRDFIVDIPTSGNFDLYSNVPKISGSDILFTENISYVESISLNNGFLNFKLKDSFLYDFLSQFEFCEVKNEDDFTKKLSAYIQLAENEKNLAGSPCVDMVFTPDVRRCVILLMKYQYTADSNIQKASVIWNEIVRLLNKIESYEENLKTFVINYEPLLIAVRGSLVKLRS